MPLQVPLSRWDKVVTVILIALVLGYAFSNAAIRASLLGQTESREARVTAVQTVDHACGKYNGETGLATTLVWSGGSDHYIDCDRRTARVGDIRTVWVLPDHPATASFNSPNGNRLLWLVVLPGAVVLLILVMPRLLLPVTSRIRTRMRRVRDSRSE